MNSRDKYKFTQYMNSSDNELMQCMNLLDNEFMQCMNSHNDINSSDYMNSHVPLCVFVPDKECDSMTDSHNNLNSLYDTQECLSNSNHKIAFDYDEDTMSLAEELSLDTLEVLLSDNTISSAGNATIAFEYHCYEIEADAP